MSDEAQYEFTPEQVKEIIAERDEARSKLQEAASTLTNVAAIDKAYDYFREQGTVKDPYAAAKTAAAQIPNLASAEDVAATLTEWTTSISSLFGTPAAPAETPPPAPEATPPPTGLARPSPSPANGGGVPAPEPLSYSSPEVQAALQRGDQAQILKWREEGRYVASPHNPYARQVPQ